MPQTRRSFEAFLADSLKSDILGNEGKGLNPAEEKPGCESSHIFIQLSRFRSISLARSATPISTPRLVQDTQPVFCNLQARHGILVGRHALPQAFVRT